MQEAQLDRQTGGRIVYLDLLRSLAIVSITVNHAVNRSFAVYFWQYLEFQRIPFSLTVIKTVLYVFSRIGVPIFVMISGALLLPRSYSGGLREGSVSRFLKHNWLPLFITTEIWLAIMFWYKQFLPESILFSEGLRSALFQFVLTQLFLNPVTMGSMWYMEMILCVYLVIPILSLAVKQIDPEYFVIPAVIVLFCSYVLRDVNAVFKALEVDFSLATKLESANIFSMFVVYLLLGYYISKGALSKIRTRVLWLVLIGGYLGFCVFQIWFFSVKYDFVVGDGYHSVFPMILAAALFELTRRYKAGTHARLETLATGLSRIAFGIYFVHICIMEGLRAVMDRYSPEIVLLTRFFILESVSFFGAVLIVRLCSKNKLMRKYLFNMK